MIRTNATIMEESERSLLAAADWLTTTYCDRVFMAQVIGPTFEIHLTINNDTVPEANQTLSDLRMYFAGKLLSWSMDQES